MSWQSYVENLMSDDKCEDCAIVGYADNKSVWAAHPTGAFKHITSQEIDVLSSKDRLALYTKGLTLASKKCSVLRDSLFEDGVFTMDIRTKNEEEDTHNISVGRTFRVLIILMGKTDIHGGHLNKTVFATVESLRQLNL